MYILQCVILCIYPSVSNVSSSSPRPRMTLLRRLCSLVTNSNNTLFVFHQNYEKEVRARCGPVHKDLHQLFGDLRDTDPTTAPVKVVKVKAATKTASKLKPKVPTAKPKSPALKTLKRKALRARGWDKMKLSKAVKVKRFSFFPCILV